MQPAREHGMGGEFCGVLCESDEGGLGNVFRQVLVADHAQRRRVHEINMPADHLAKSRFRAALNVFVQELMVAYVVHSYDSTHPWRNRTDFGANDFREVIAVAAYAAVEKIKIECAQFRRDIGAKAMK